MSRAAPGSRKVEEGGAGGQEVALFEKRIRRLEQEKQELNRKLQGQEGKWVLVNVAFTDGPDP